MAVRVTKEQTLRTMRVIWFAFIMSVVLYIYVCKMIRPSSPSGAETTLFVVPAVLDLLSFLWIRFKRYAPALQSLQSQPEDVRAVAKWRVFLVALLAMAEAEILFGVVSWMLNGIFRQSLPFFVLGSLLLLSLWPRQFWSSSPIADDRPLG